MAKKKSKLSHGAAQFTESSKLPSFDENALSALTARIEQGLDKKQPDGGQASTPSSFPKQVQSRAGPASTNKSESKSKSKSKAAPPVARGVKRDVNGNAKSTGGVVRSMKGADKKEIGTENQRDILLQEILALGGTAEDLDLVADALSDEEGEYEAIPPVDKSFQQDLARFVKGLGIEKSTEQDLAEEPEEEENVVEDDWEASESGSLDDASVIEDEPSRKPQVKAPVEKQVPNDLNRLVSTSSSSSCDLSDEAQVDLSSSA